MFPWTASVPNTSGFADVVVEDGEFVGYVGNETTLSGIDMEAEFRASFDEISDWMVMLDDEIKHGGYTVELLTQRQRRD